MSKGSQRVRKAVIPAAGLGTRFLPATKAIPKEMLPIVDIPTVQYIVEEAVASGIEEILIITNSNKHCMENHFDKDYELEARLTESGKMKEVKMINDIANMANIYYV
ncbi:sugar phosphate nucleotidyltransferase, partial [Anaerostipes butyraticus]|uniref:sugar phosphate nucleotidyltransferase n=1 Tax=Anaerostipes butyraticus TaxID=645466 RepID=UPI0023A7D3E0